MSNFIKRLVRRYIYHSDIDESMRKVDRVLAEGKEREARAFWKVASVTGSEEATQRARKAERQARQFRQRLSDEIAVDVFGDD
ncbi:MAG: hypothetical protein M3R38_29845 [Actinomycetota bacterium]|nr:hypothetical protein [Actinomycetota bacterium]